mgnify:CR=1 FL=1|tara:strand:+ start:13982 stop:14146 length:165 start_codon:yes stop_codon:yes gene_type:complete
MHKAGGCSSGSIGYSLLATGAGMMLAGPSANFAPTLAAERPAQPRQKFKIEHDK